jgi:ferredoxin
MNRREFFGFINTGVKKRAGEMLVSFADESGSKKTVFASDKSTSDGSFAYDIKALGGDELLNQVREKGLVKTVRLDDRKCTLCGVCVRLCAFGVFTEIKETLKGRETLVKIITDQQRCTGCGVCTLSCAPKAIEIV